MDLLLLPYCHHLQCILGTKVYLYVYYIYMMLYIQDLNELHVLTRLVQVDTPETCFAHFFKRNKRNRIKRRQTSLLKI